MRATNRVEYV